MQLKQKLGILAWWWRVGHGDVGVEKGQQSSSYAHRAEINTLKNHVHRFSDICCRSKEQRAAMKCRCASIRGSKTGVMPRSWGGNPSPALRVLQTIWIVPKRTATPHGLKNDWFIISYSAWAATSLYVLMGFEDSDSVYIPLIGWFLLRSNKYLHNLRPVWLSQNMTTRTFLQALEALFINVMPHSC